MFQYVFYFKILSRYLLLHTVLFALLIMQVNS